MVEDVAGWMARIRARDPDGLDGLVRRMEARLLRLATGMLRDPALAADAAQETFLTVWQGIDGYREGSDPEAWIVTLCLNRCRDMLRRQRLERRLPERLPQPAASTPEPSSLETAEARHRILEAVAALPLREREAFLLMGVEGYTSARAAEATGSTPAAVRESLGRARKTLRERLTPKS